MSICTHYHRWLIPICHTCKKPFNCHFCHDEVSDHKMIRNKTLMMKCLLCNCIQQISKVCINPECIKKVHQYTCLKCSMWENKKNRELYHCDKCGICRVGIKEQVKHCDKCNLCIKKRYFNQHICSHDNKNTDCPICLEPAWEGQKLTTTLKCGHIIHHDCLNQYVKNSINYKCPLCNKSMFNMSNYWIQIENYVNSQEMPDEYMNWKSEIICCDCNKTSITKYHFEYHKCQNCNSWNTIVNHVHKLQV